MQRTPVRVMTKIPLAQLTNADIVNDIDLQEALLNIEETWERNEFNIDKNDYEFKGEVEEPPSDANIESLKNLTLQKKRRN